MRCEPIKMSSLMSFKCFPTLHIMMMMMIIIPQLTPPVKASFNDQPLPCHKVHDKGNLANAETVDEIDKSIQELYDEIEKDAQHEEDCTYAIETGNDTNIVLTELMETFELRRDNYERGLWGYCGKEGADNLIQSIAAIKAKVIAEKGNNRPITMCDRNNLLSCHESFEKCQCLRDYRSFRNIASVFSSNAEDKEGDTRMAGHCILVSGSDCPVDTSVFMCMPGTNCMTKDKMMPCLSKYLRKAMGRSKPRHKRDGDSTGESQVNGGSSSPSGGSGGGAVGGDRNTGNVTNTNISPRTKTQQLYSMSRPDYPSIYCQCTGYQGTERERSGGPTLGNFPASSKYNMICMGSLILSITRFSFIMI